MSLLGHPDVREGGPRLSWGMTSSEGQNPGSGPDWPTRRWTNRRQDLAAAWGVCYSFHRPKNGPLISEGRKGGSKRDLGNSAPLPLTNERLSRHTALRGSFLSAGLDAARLMNCCSEPVRAFKFTPSNVVFYQWLTVRTGLGVSRPSVEAQRCQVLSSWPQASTRPSRPWLPAVQTPG